MLGSKSWSFSPSSSLLKQAEFFWGGMDGGLLPHVCTEEGWEGSTDVSPQLRLSKSLLELGGGEGLGLIS